MKKITATLFFALSVSLFSTPIAAVASSGPYISSNLGYDISFASTSYPTPFGFGIVGVTGGKAFLHNTRVAFEFSWARFGSATAPTLYMNLNAPYGSTVAGHISTPKTCVPNIASSTNPTACEGYNYGYNAATDAVAYAKKNGVTASLWWLDIEEANSWSPDTTVNDATIQGAMDYLNTQGIRVGVYSVANMWNNIAGSGFVPIQKISGQTYTTPVWVPIGITNQIGATNACIKSKSFISGNPIWIVQFETSSTAIDQNYAC